MSPPGRYPPASCCPGRLGPPAGQQEPGPRPGLRAHPNDSRVLLTAIRTTASSTMVLSNTSPQQQQVGTYCPCPGQPCPGQPAREAQPGPGQVGPGQVAAQPTAATTSRATQMLPDRSGRTKVQRAPGMRQLTGIDSTIEPIYAPENGRHQREGCHAESQESARATAEEGSVQVAPTCRQGFRCGWKLWRHHALLPKESDEAARR